MIEPDHPRLSIVRQCELASISRSSFYREPAVESEGTLRLMRMIDELWRSLKYECVFLNAFETDSEATAGIGRWIAYYNIDRPHSTSAAGRLFQVSVDSFHVLEAE